MKSLAYSIYDNKTEIFNTPFFAISDGAALRSFKDLANDLNTTVGRHPNDFALHCVGSFNDQNAELVNISPSRFVANAASLIDKEAEQPIFAEFNTSANGKAL